MIRYVDTDGELIVESDTISEDSYACIIQEELVQLFNNANYVLTIEKNIDERKEM